MPSICWPKLITFIALVGSAGTLLVDTVYWLIPDPAFPLFVLLNLTGFGCLALWHDDKKAKTWTKLP